MKLATKEFEKGPTLTALVRYQVSDFHDLVTAHFFICIRLDDVLNRGIKVMFEIQPPCSSPPNSSRRDNASVVIGTKAYFRIVIPDFRPVDAAINTFNETSYCLRAIRGCAGLLKSAKVSHLSDPYAAATRAFVSMTAPGRDCLSFGMRLFVSLASCSETVLKGSGYSQ